jgi:hypothetical protein
MKEELKGPKMTEAGVAVVREQNEKGELIYNVYLINFYNTKLEGVLVTSVGYATHPDTQEEIKTSTLRHSLGDIPAKSYKKIEPIIEEVFGLNNEYWVSFWIADQMYDKKFIFLTESISESNFVKVPLIEKRGVLIK